MKITVTAEDIANGNPGDSGSCPIAHAVRRATGTRFVEADQGRICIDDAKAATPKDADDFMGDFDEGKPVSPFEFEVEFETEMDGYDDEY